MKSSLKKMTAIFVRRGAQEARFQETAVRAMLEGTAAFAIGGLALEWLHPGLVSDVVPWSAVAGVGLVLIAILAWLPSERRAAPTPGRNLLPLVVTLLAACLAGAAAHAYFASIPRFQMILAATVAVIVLLGTFVLTGDDRQGRA